ncbi:SHOCT domain-containing protein [Gelidibacter salicanalis]|uniref:SHOCT domain-containing protein n=1 Tax=Gelidibacter salicanalis TaxID=291193 RepID=A0A934KY85_9FLAO|nr:SHOCT domain-containing protein [Gelidibacter salicanalis]MBJ7882578.1 SHOCT domain-containing protein [Gelidibacter salicanalis]
MHFYDGHFGGMHLIWWIIWIILIAWIFFIPADIPYQKTKKESPLDILKKRFAKGEISKEEFEDSKKILNSESTKNLNS